MKTPEKPAPFVATELERACRALRIYGPYAGLKHLANSACPFWAAHLVHTGHMPRR